MNKLSINELSHLVATSGKGELAIFCGAGISMNSGFPLAMELKQYVLEKLPITSYDVGEILCSDLPFESVFQILSDNSDIADIIQMFTLGVPNATHKMIAQLVHSGKSRTIATTNFDLLLERAFLDLGLEEGRHFCVLVREEQLFGFEELDSSKAMLLKVHGSANDPISIRITLNDIAKSQLSEKRKKAIEYIFSSGNHSKVLILGYSCSDELDIIPEIRRLAPVYKL